MIMWVTWFMWSEYVPFICMFAHWFPPKNVISYLSPDINTSKIWWDYVEGIRMMVIEIRKRQSILTKYSEAYKAMVLQIYLTICSPLRIIARFIDRDGAQIGRLSHLFYSHGTTNMGTSIHFVHLYKIMHARTTITSLHRATTKSLQHYFKLITHRIPVMSPVWIFGGRIG